MTANSTQPSPRPNGPQAGSSDPSAATGIQANPTHPHGHAETPAGPDVRIPLPPFTAPAAPLPTSRTRAQILSGLDIAVVALVLALAFLSASFIVRNSDYFFHLATGRALTEGRYHFGQDPFAYTSEGLYWANPSWLYDLVLFRMHEGLDGATLVVLKALVVTLVAGVMLLTRRRGLGLWLPAIGTGLAVLAMSPRFFFQPILLSFLFLALTHWLTEPAAWANGSKAVPPWRYLILIPLFALWANVDGWFLLGPAAVALTLIGNLVEGRPGPGREGPAPQELRWLTVALVGGLAACLLNPHGYHVFTLPQEMSPAVPVVLKNDTLFRSMFLSPWSREYVDRAVYPAGLAYYVLTLAGFLSFLVNGAGLRWGRLLIWTGFLLLSGYAGRTVPFFAVVSGPILTLNLQDYAVHLAASRPNHWSRIPALGSAGRVLSLIVAVALVVCAWPGWLQVSPVDQRHVGWGVEPDAALQGAARQLRTWRQQGVLAAGSHGFATTPELAAYCAWECPEEKAFLDTRFTLFAGVADDFKTVRAAFAEAPKADEGGEEAPVLERLDPAVAPILRKHGIDHVLFTDFDLSRTGRAMTRLGADHAQWRLLGIEGRVVCFGWIDPEDKRRPAFDGVEYDPSTAALETARTRDPSPPLPPPPLPRQWWDTFTEPAPRGRPAGADEAWLELEFTKVVMERALEKELRRHFTIVVAQAVASGPALSNPGSGLTYWLWNGPLLGRIPQLNLQVAPSPALLAIQACKRALVTNPQSAEAYFNLGQAYLRLPEANAPQDYDHPGYLPASIRRCQAAAAFRNAITLKPEYLDPHLAFFDLLRQEKFLDLALGQLQDAVRILRSPPSGRNANPEENRRLLEAVEQRVKLFDDKVREAQNEFQIASSNLPLMSKVQLAREGGLGGKALELLTQASEVELIASDTNQNFDAGQDAVRLMLDLLLRCGRVRDARDVFNPGFLEVHKVKRLGGGFVSSYKWIGLQLAAVEGRLEDADHLLEAMISEVVERNHAEHGSPQFGQMIKGSLTGLLALDLPNAVPLAVKLQTVLRREQAKMMLYRVSAVPVEELDLNVVRGLLALEQGEPRQAIRRFQQAESLAWPPARYGVFLGMLGGPAPLPPAVFAAVAQATAAPPAMVAYPTRELATRYLSLLEAANR